ncbi:hypothetical protein BDU57DRAFT_435619 [Ampelomyces quisqualis]|uniref:Uncharacterized protein n=1 Tax=Ampelomyces quisqualis TaxID=50730 RepID=A0A6A5R5J4_AMPQU|nr:hypothetical protein BDU57DRAFT_435619 [Ampelomyces quisqualis]
MSKVPLVWEWTTSVALLIILVAADRSRTKPYLPNFEHIVSTRPPPHDPRTLTESDPDFPVRDCAAWVAEVLEEIRALLRRGGLAA